MAEGSIPRFELLEPGTTCRLVATASRAKMLVDAADYFETLRRTLLRAKRSIHIVGWDIDSRTDLLGGAPAETGPEGAPTRLKPLLTHLVDARPELQVRLLLWDYTLLYAADREPLPTLNLNWVTPPQIEVCLDDVLPIGACHHQKIVVVDDAVAFCGGLDLTQHRWDTPEHKAGDSRRTDSAGRAYGPFHDVQMMVDGEAARALAEVVNKRWHEATCEAPVPVRPLGNPWPEDTRPDFHDIPVGLALTVPELQERPESREVEALYRRAIASAETAIYIENQYLTSDTILEALVSRLNEAPGLEVLCIGPKGSDGWLEEKSMGAGRHRFLQALADQGHGERVRFLYPETPADDGAPPEAVKIHSKVMVVDDRFLTVGSANLNNRSMGFDTECNLAIEARREAERATIAGLRDRLLAEHLGMDRVDVSKAIATKGLLAVADSRTDTPGRRLRPIEENEAYDDPMATVLLHLADPERPIAMPELSLEQFQGQVELSSRTKALSGIAVLVLLVASFLAWNETPLSRLTDIDQVRPYFQTIADSRWTAVLVPLIYLVAGFVLFPITVLITLTAVVFGPVEAFVHAVLGILVSATATYGLGALAGRRYLRRLMGKRLNRISRAIGRRGVAAVVGLRVAPVAPYSFINMVAGASHIRFRDFTVGTLIGMAPGVAVLVWLGKSLWETLADPSPGQIGLLLAAATAWVALGLGLQRLFDRWRARRKAAGEPDR